MTDDSHDNCPDSAFVKAMRSRVVVRQEQDYGKRKAGPRRPKGQPKTGGRKAGTPNLWSPEFRNHLAEKAKPFELLADICAGRLIKDGDSKRYPSVQERMRAAETLSRKLLPDLSAAQVSSIVADAKDVQPDTLCMPGMDPDISLAMNLAFLLRRRQAKLDQAKIRRESQDRERAIEGAIEAEFLSPSRHQRPRAQRRNLSLSVTIASGLPCWHLAFL